MPVSAMSLRGLCILCMSVLCAAQDLGVPTSWRVRTLVYNIYYKALIPKLYRNFQTSMICLRVFQRLRTVSTLYFLSLIPRLHSSMVSSTAGDYIGQFKVDARVGIGYWQSGNVFSVMANQDQLAGSTTNQANVVNNLNKAFGLYSNYDQYGYNDDAMYVG